MEYQIAWGSDDDDLAREVNKRLKAGWELYGNLVVVVLPVNEQRPDYPTNRFYQTMTRQQPPTSEPS